MLESVDSWSHLAIIPHKRQLGARRRQYPTAVSSTGCRQPPPRPAICQLSSCPHGRTLLLTWKPVEGFQTWQTDGFRLRAGNRVYTPLPAVPGPPTSTCSVLHAAVAFRARWLQPLPLPLAGCFGWGQGSYLVDPASSHMLVSKIKPCMSKYKQHIQ